MSQAHDSECSCGCRVSWFGRLHDCPPCPACGSPQDLRYVAWEERLYEAARKCVDAARQP